MRDLLHRFLQVRTEVLDEEWEGCFRQQYSSFRPLPIEALTIAA